MFLYYTTIQVGYELETEGKRLTVVQKEHIQVKIKTHISKGVSGNKIKLTAKFDGDENEKFGEYSYSWNPTIFQYIFSNNTPTKMDMSKENKVISSTTEKDLIITAIEEGSINVSVIVRKLSVDLKSQVPREGECAIELDIYPGRP